MTPRRNRVSEHLAAAVAYASGVAAAFSPPSPTARPLVDAAIVGMATAGVVYASASAPWWALGLAGGVALAAGLNPILVAVAALAFGLAMWVGIKRRNMPELRAISAGLSLNVLAWSQLGGFFGLTSLLGLGVAVLLFVTGIRRRPRAIRRRAWQFVGVAAVIAAFATLGFGLAASVSRADLRNGNRLVNDGIAALNQGQFTTASERFADASKALARAEDALGKPWASGAAFVPVVAQHRAAGLKLSSAGAEELATVADALTQIHPETLRTTAGRIDLRAIEALAEPFGEVDRALDRMARQAAGADSAWLVPPVADQVDDLNTKIAKNAPRVDNAVAAVELAPAMLGAERSAVYLVLFTSPAEARGLGGFIGNYAELTVTDGQLALTDFGRASDLEQQALANSARLPGPEGFLARYGRFGFDNDGAGTVGNVSFRNLTMTPHFPWVGDVSSELYRQATGRSVDGVIVLDAYVVQALLAYTGPIDLAEFDVRLTDENAADYILRGQYELAPDQAQRIDALEEAARLTTDALLAGSLPDPTQLARDLGPFVAERRLLMWSRDVDQQALLRGVGMLGEIPSLEGGDGWSVAVTNASGNKIDTLLERRVRHASRTEDGVTRSSLTIELTNTAPSGGLPDYVIGNVIGLTRGTNRMYVSVYSALGIAEYRVDGEPSGIEAETEAGWNVYSRYLDLAPGQTVTLELRLEGVVADPDRVVTWTQPLATPLEQLGPGGG